MLSGRIVVDRAKSEQESDGLTTTALSMRVLRHVNRLHRSSASILAVRVEYLFPY